MRKFEDEEKAEGGESSGDHNENTESLSEDAEIGISDAEEAVVEETETETDITMKKPPGESVEIEEGVRDPDVAKAEPSASKKRNRPKKSAAADGDANSTTERKSRRVGDDGNDSPSSPLNVCSDHEL